MTVLAVTGLLREARILRGPRVLVVASGGDTQNLEAKIDRFLVAEIEGIISIGIGGGLDPMLRTGDVVIGDKINAPDGMFYESEPAWISSLEQKLLHAKTGAILGSDVMVRDSVAKAMLYRETRALAIDMESHIAAACAVKAGLPFAALRVISDPSSRSLPSAVTVGMKPDGQMNIGGVVKAIAADPLQIPSLVRTGLDAGTAFRSLLRCHDLLGVGLGLPDFGELMFDVT